MTTTTTDRRATTGGTGAPDTSAAGPATTGGPETTGGTETTADGPETTAGGGAVDLASVCPDPIVIQTDWFPESEHGALYNMVGEGLRGRRRPAGRVGTARRRRPGHRRGHRDPHRRAGDRRPDHRRGRLRRREHQPRLPEHRGSGAPARRHPADLGHRPARDQPADHLLGPGDLPGRRRRWPTSARRTSRSTSSAEGVLRRVRRQRHLERGPGRSRRTTAAPPGSSPRTGRSPNRGSPPPSPTPTSTCSRSGASPSPTRPSTTPGSRCTRRRSSVREADLEELRPCLEQLVPIIQQSAIDFVNDPARANEIIIDAVAQYDGFWVYDEGLAEYSVETQRELGLVGNGPDDTLGNMDESADPDRDRPDPRRRRAWTSPPTWWPPTCSPTSSSTPTSDCDVHAWQRSERRSASHHHHRHPRPLGPPGRRVDPQPPVEPRSDRRGADRRRQGDPRRRPRADPPPTSSSRGGGTTSPTRTSATGRATSRWCGTASRRSRRSPATSGSSSTPKVPGLVSVGLVESTEFDRCRTVRLTRYAPEATRTGRVYQR